MYFLKKEVRLVVIVSIPVSKDAHTIKALLVARVILHDSGSLFCKSPFSIFMFFMRGSRNFHERGSNENGNFWSQTRGGPTPKKSRNYLFLGKIFKFQGGSGPPVPPSGSAHAFILFAAMKLSCHDARKKRRLQESIVQAKIMIHAEHKNNEKSMIRKNWC